MNECQKRQVPIMRVCVLRVCLGLYLFKNLSSNGTKVPRVVGNREISQHHFALGNQAMNDRHRRLVLVAINN